MISKTMEEINNPHDVYFRESFTRREIAQDFLRQQLPAELLELEQLTDFLIMLGEMTPLEQTRAYREIVAKNQPIWLEEGRQREVQLALRLLRRRLSKLTKAQQASVQSLPVEQLEDLGEALPRLQRRR
ncbi:Rpn family recombination-promoting nuclease/putative transposase [Halochromatium salexigens]|uniref:Uncharacterized protein n=1 Tax=Halochromatium salexigens TaxID=49447 RepID=A0AAJ0UER5_HALSE|nr:Rpn family recombination-promoting nuclease/putative transposase [Halochromatium salexigens]MBK5929963.1 hypothetical protein [Halochromatium salexigens]